jgi:hypothetical protein
LRPAWATEKRGDRERRGGEGIRGRGNRREEREDEEKERNKIVNVVAEFI